MSRLTTFSTTSARGSEVRQERGASHRHRVSLFAGGRPGISTFRERLALIAVAALGIRLVYILLIAPIPIGVGGDASFYHSAANLIAQGHFYDRRIFGHAHPTALHPPLYSMLLSVVAALGGVHLLPQRIVGCVVGSVSVLLIGSLGREVHNDRAGLVAAMVAAVYPPFITADGSLMSEPVYVLLVAAALILAFRLVAAPGVRWSLALGAVIGLGILARTEAVVLVPLLAWPSAWGPARGRVGRVVAATLATVVVVAPWVVRNAVAFHKLELAANYDTVIPAANCHGTYYGSDIGWWSMECLARARTVHQFLIGDASPAPGLRYARSHPARAVLVAGVRVLRTFSFYQPMRLGNHEPRVRWVDLAGLIIYYPLLALAVLGAAWFRRRRWIMLAPIVGTVLVTATGWGNGRFRSAADVSIIVLAGIAVAILSDRRGTTFRSAGGRSRRPAAPAQTA